MSNWQDNILWWYDHTPSHDSVYAGNECWALFSLIGQALQSTRVAEASRKLSSCYSPQKQRSVCRCTLLGQTGRNLIQPLRAVNVSSWFVGFCGHKLPKFGFDVFAESVQVKRSFHKGSEDVRIWWLKMRVFWVQQSSFAAQGLKDPKINASRKGTTRYNKWEWEQIWILSLCQLGQLGCSRCTISC